jgi:alkanesulfonate monooxygenase SsuD/methylene tetrahydromethanopterin reductase-like flavin-dependent oxidoreductase (luciferase family)
VEANGYSALQVADHYIGPGPKLDPTNHPVQELAAIPAVAMAAEATGSLRIGCRMLCIDYHQPVVLGLAGAKADIVSINFDNSSGMIGPAGFASSTAEKTREKIEWVRAGAGPRFGGIELETAAYFVAVEGGSGPSPDRLSAVTGMTLDELRAFPHALVGSVDAICEKLERRRAEFGFSYVTVGDAVAEDFAPVVARLAGK